MNVGFRMDDLGFAGTGGCVSVCENPASYFRHHTSSRRGISLLEVLISIGIMAIGLVSLLSLLPVGGIQAQRAGIEQRKAELGLNVYKDFKTRGMGYVDQATGTCPWLRYNGTNWIPYFSTPPAAADFPPVAIDPLMAAAAAGNTFVQTFPANPLAAPAPTMQRLTLSSVYHATPTTYFALADSVFRAADDIVIDRGNDAQLPPTNQYANDPATGNPMKRDSLGMFSWLATISPYYPDQALSAPVAGQHCTLALAIFYRRSLPNPAAFNLSLVREGQATVTAAGTSLSTDYSSLSGGEVRLQVTAPPGGFSTTNPNPLSYARPGSWLMLCRNKADAAGNLIRIFKWYRVVAAEFVDESSPPPAAPGQSVTLAGPDWEFAPTQSPTYDNEQTYACLFDGVVAVYERTIQLEGPSQWSQ